MNVSSRCAGYKEVVSYIVVSSLLCISFISCSDKPPVPEKDFIEVYVQLQLFEAQYASRPIEQKVKADSILKAYNLNQARVDTMLAWYSRKPERWHDFFVRVQERMKEIKSAYLRPKR